MKEETDKVIGAAIEVNRELGFGFLEIVYKDALSLEFRNRNIFFEREKEYLVYYKNIILPHEFYADFIIMNQIILGIKAKDGIADEDMAQTINYLKCLKSKARMILNFSRMKLDIKRVVL